MKDSKYRILYVDDEKYNLHTFKAAFKWDYTIITARSAFEALELLENHDIHIIISDQRMPELSGTEFFKRVLVKHPDPIRIILTGYSDLEVIVRAINECGIYQYMTKPWNEAEMAQVLKNAGEIYQLRRDNLELVSKLSKENLALEEENHYLKEEIRKAHNNQVIITQSPSFQKTLQLLKQVAVTQSTVLIRGETGTGKELLARAVHESSTRADKPLVKVNCAALPPNLIESELFGHEKGAFTGAIQHRIGRFELANKGTIFLDEVGELPLDLQVKLLRVLQEGEFERLGSSKTQKTDVRVIAATNRNLEASVQEGTFREDLFFRLNVFPITALPLRERKEDISLLVEHFLKKYEPNIGRKITKVSKDVIKQLEAYDWPGNIRELENIIERSMITSSGDFLELGSWHKIAPTKIPEENKLLSMEEMEYLHISKALREAGWKVSGKQGAAQRLKLNPKTLFSRMAKLGIKRPADM